MALVVAAVFLSACGSKDETIAELEERIAELEQPSSTTESPTTTRATTTTAVGTTTVPPTTLGSSRSDSELILEQAYIETMRDESSDLQEVTWVDVSDDEFLVEWGHLFCFQMEQHDGDWVDALMFSIAAGEEAFGSSWNADDESMVAFGSGSAVYAFCPEYIGSIGD